MTPAEVAELLRVSPYTVMRWARTQAIPAHRVGRTWRIWRKDALSLLGGGPAEDAR